MTAPKRSFGPRLTDEARRSYIEDVRSDGARLIDLASSALDARVESCPQWTVRDLVLHAGLVHRNKARQVADAMLESCPIIEQPADGEDLSEWYRVGLVTLLNALEHADPERPVWSWHPFQWDADFWIRRMAHETAVHRVDAELAVDARTPTRRELALDGIDEILDVWLTHRPRLSGYRGDGESIRVSSSGESWAVTLHPTEVSLVRGRRRAKVDVTIDGDPEDVYLWLWGRASDDRVQICGDRAAVASLRAQIRAVI